MFPNKGFLETILNNEEGIGVDFKARVDLDSDGGKAKFVKTILALANSPLKSSMMILGVEDKTKNVIGIQDDVSEERLQNIVHTYCTPPITFSFRILDHNNNKVGLITINGYRRPYTPKEKYLDLLPDKQKQGVSEKTVFVRHGSTIDTAHPEEIMEMERERNNIDRELSEENISLDFSEISGSIKRIRWALERTEVHYSRDRAIEYAAIGIVSGFFISYLLFFSWDYYPASLIKILTPVVVAIILSVLRVVRFGLTRSILAGIMMGIVFGVLSETLDNIVLKNINTTSPITLVLMIWGCIKGLLSSVPIIYLSSKLGLDNI